MDAEETPQTSPQDPPRAAPAAATAPSVQSSDGVRIPRHARTSLMTSAGACGPLDGGGAGRGRSPALRR
ncbi:hypothetical protein, partial [Streptomyces sp. LNU-CPARS28]|uniref:hypothetical protein n=1 Tax=Streptomyces sp. LNU-CPARS28 TaxID=3137371 RepID=UPI003135D2D3